MDAAFERIAYYYMQDYAPMEEVREQALQHVVEACSAVFPLLSKTEIQTAAAALWQHYVAKHAPHNDTPERQQLRAKLRKALGLLTTSERAVLELRFGLLDGRDYTIEEVSQKLKVTRERVRRLEERIYYKLRDYLT